MKMKIEDGELIVIEADNIQYSIIKSWNMMRWDRKKKWIIGSATAELLNKMKELVRNLPAPIEAERQRMNRLQEIVDAERKKKEPVPLYDYPVKLPLFAHQTRGANMALLTFGLIDPENLEEKRK